MYSEILSLVFPFILTLIQKSNAGDCTRKCPVVDSDKLICVFFEHRREYKLFPNECNLIAYKECNDIPISYVSPIKFCIKHKSKKFRRFYGESCPVFCPDHYRPVCGASKLRDYAYRSFKNGCHLDMLNCRGEDEYMGYVEVPLSFCQRHSMRNIFKEKIQVYGHRDYGEIL